jgi:hypothetical protein
MNIESFSFLQHQRRTDSEDAFTPIKTNAELLTMTYNHDFVIPHSIKTRAMHLSNSPPVCPWQSMRLLRCSVNRTSMGNLCVDGLNQRTVASSTYLILVALTAPKEPQKSQKEKPSKHSSDDAPDQLAMSISLEMLPVLVKSTVWLVFHAQWSSTCTFLDTFEASPQACRSLNICGTIPVFDVVIGRDGFVLAGRTWFCCGSNCSDELGCHAWQGGIDELECHA